MIIRINCLIFLYVLILLCHSEDDCKFDKTGKCKLNSSGKADEVIKILMSRINEMETNLLDAFSRLEKKCKTHKGVGEIAGNRPASYLLDAMNTNIDPCEDFYEYSCGKWIQSHPEAVSIQYESELLQRKFMEYFNLETNSTDLPTSIRKIMQAYIVCKDYGGITGSMYDWIKTKLVDMGGWPIIENFWPKIEWKHLLTKVFTTFKIRGPIEVTVSNDPVHTEDNFITVGQPGSDIEKIDIEYVTAFAEYFSKERNETLREKMKSVERTEQLIANLSKPLQALIDANELRRMKIEDLQRIIPTVDWVHFLRSVFNLPYRQTANAIRKDTIVYVGGITYLKTIVKYLDSGIISTETLANYAVASFINKFATTFPLVLTNEEMKNQMQNIRCQMEFSNIRPFVDYFYRKHRKEKTVDIKMVTYMLDVLRDMVDVSEWLDEPTKEKVKEKLDAIVLLKDFPEWSNDPEKLDEYFKCLSSMTRNPFENKLNLDNYIQNKDSQRLIEKNDRNYWPRIAQAGGSVTNAFNNFELNQIVIPAGIQNLPFFDPNRPAYMNFGGLGLVVGHEITHGFDKMGSERDKHGNEKNWWTEKSKAEFERKSKCLIDHYDSFNYGRSGYDTLSENIADNGGLRQSYLAMRRWEKDFGVEEVLPGLENYTIDQLFFISFARTWCDSRDPKEVARTETDNHSANKIRVLASLQNMKEFSEAFKCKNGSRMNPVNKCVIW